MDEKRSDLSAVSQPRDEGGRGKRTQKTILLPCGSALHRAMNRVLNLRTLGTRFFFMPHNRAVCPRVWSGLLAQCANEPAMVPGVPIPNLHD